MYSPTHATIGLIVAASLPDPVTAFFVGVATHYALDAIPHGDTGVGDWLRTPGAARRIIVVESIDLGSTALVVAGLLQNHPHTLWLRLVAGALGGITPDLLWGARFIIDRLRWRIPIITRCLHLHDRWHKWGHAQAAYDIPFTVGVVGQVALIVVALSLHL